MRCYNKTFMTFQIRSLRFPNSIIMVRKLGAQNFFKTYAQRPKPFDENTENVNSGKDSTSKDSSPSKCKTG